MGSDRASVTPWKTRWAEARGGFAASVRCLYYRADNGVKWRNLPSDFPAWQTVYSYFRAWVRFGVWEEINLALVKSVRQAVGREAEPSLTIIGSQSVKLGQKGGRNWSGCQQKGKALLNCYDLPSSPALLPNGEGSKNSCPLSIWERTTVRGVSAIHISIQQRRFV